MANRVKSHMDVGERWYPEILAQVRAEQAAMRVKVEGPGEASVSRAGEQNVGVTEGPQTIRAY